MNLIQSSLNFKLATCSHYPDGLLEATLTPARFPKPLKLATLLIGLTVPLLVSAGTIIRLVSFIIGSAVRFERYAIYVIRLKFCLILSRRHEKEEKTCVGC